MFLSGSSGSRQGFLDHLSESRYPYFCVRAGLRLPLQSRQTNTHTVLRSSNHGNEARACSSKGPERSPPQPYVLITRSFYFHGNSRIRDFSLKTITNIRYLTIKPVSSPISNTRKGDTASPHHRPAAALPKAVRWQRGQATLRPHHRVWPCSGSSSKSRTVPSVFTLASLNQSIRLPESLQYIRRWKFLTDGG